MPTLRKELQCLRHGHSPALSTTDSANRGTDHHAHPSANTCADAHPRAGGLADECAHCLANRGTDHNTHAELCVDEHHGHADFSTRHASSFSKAGHTTWTGVS